MSGVGYQVLIAGGAKADLVECRERDRHAAAHISAHLRELGSDPTRCDLLADEHYSDELIDSIEPVWSLQGQRINAYRVKYVLLARWRVITAADHRGRRIAILAVMPRDADYQSDRALWARIEREYDDLGFPRMGR